MKKITYLILGLLSISIALSSCKDPKEGTTYTIFDIKPIGQALETTGKGDFSMWVDMLKKTELYNALNVRKTYTVFAATNSVVEDYLAEKGYSSIDDIDAGVLKEIMQYHIVVGSSIPHDAMTIGRLMDTTATGDYIITKVVDGDNVLVDDRSYILKSVDISAINGTIHVLDKVLDPVLESLWDVIKANSDYSIFLDAITRTGLNELLSERYYYITDPISGTQNRFRRRLTLFMVSDQVFNYNGIYSFEDIAALYSPSNSDYTNESNQVYQYVAYHIVNGLNAYNDLATFPNVSNKKKNMSTFASNELMQIEDINGTLILNKEAPEGGTGLISYDSQAKNGIYHNIDGVLPLYTPKPTQLDLEFTDVAVWPEYAIIPFYRQTGYGNTQTYELSTDKFPFFRIQAEDGYVRYQSRGTGWVIGDLKYGDVLEANLGGVGWFEIDLPPIVAGRYNLSISFHRGPERGVYQILIDGLPTGAPVSFSGGFAYVWTPALTVSFLQSGSHTLRFSQVSAGIMEVDVCRFTPVL